jgi:hypothetical protein
MPLGGPPAFDDHDSKRAWRRHLTYAYINLGSSLASAAAFASGKENTVVWLASISIGLTMLAFTVRQFFKCWALRRILMQSSWTVQQVELELLNRKAGLGNDVTVTRISFAVGDERVRLETIPGDGTVNARKVLRPIGVESETTVQLYEVRIAGPVAGTWALSDPDGRKLFRARASDGRASTPTHKVVINGVNLPSPQGFD